MQQPIECQGPQFKSWAQHSCPQTELQEPTNLDITWGQHVEFLCVLGFLHRSISIAIKNNNIPVH